MTPIEEKLREEILQKLKKRHFFNGQHYNLDEEKRQLRLSSQYHKKLLEKKLWGRYGFKKIGGSSIGSILGVDSYQDPFSAFVRIAWLDMPILDKTYINAGIILEPVLLKMLQENFNPSIKGFKASDYDFNYFRGNGGVIGGVPDALMEDKGILLEFKTTSVKNRDKWTRFGLPSSYLKQAQLYARLMDLKLFSIVALFLEAEDYIHPDMVDIKKRFIKSWTFQVNYDQVDDDIKAAKDWYDYHTSLGVSPEWIEGVSDNNLLDYLRCHNAEEWSTLLEQWELAGKINFKTLI